MTSNANGYSLVELMITVAVLGLAAGITLPNLNRNWDDERLNSTTKIMSSWLDDVRRRAIQTSEPCGISLNADTATLAATADNTCGSFDALALRDLIPSNKPLQITASENSPTSWWFTPRGTLAFNAANSDAQHISFRLTISGNTQQGRCLKVTAPLALLRSGKLRSGTCVYTSAF